MTDELLKNQKDAMDAFLASDDSFQGFGFGSQAIQTGFEGKVEKFEFTPIQGAGVNKRSQEQMLNTKKGPIMVSTKDEYSVAPSIVFEGGARQVTLNSLTSHPKSHIILEKDGDPLYFNKMSGKQWNALVGKEIVCVLAENDESLKIPRVKRFGKEGDTELRAVRRYAFAIKGAEPEGDIVW